MMYALCLSPFFFFFFNDTATTEIYTLSLHDALPISATWSSSWPSASAFAVSASVHAPARRTKILRSSTARTPSRSEEHTSELQSQSNLVCRLLLEKKKQPPRPSRRQCHHSSALNYYP